MKQLVSMLLAAAMLFACAPMAAAQRSISSPEEDFVLPEEKTDGLFHADTADTGNELLDLIFRQLFYGDVEPQRLIDFMRKQPLVKEGDPLPPMRDPGFDSFFTTLLKSGTPEQEQEADAFFKAMFTGEFSSAYAALRETGTPDEYQMIFIYTDAAGNPYWCDVDIMYNDKTGRVYSLGGAGVLSLGYDYDLSQFMICIDGNSVANREYGFNVFFDVFAFMIGDVYITQRFPFQYNEKDYQIQIWKGVFTFFGAGGDIGIYEKPSNRLIFWDSSDTELDIGLHMYKDGELLFDHGTRHSWWVGGFRIVTPFAGLPWRLRMQGSITFEDPEMLEAFLASFEKNRDDSITGTVDGMTFSFVW